MQFKWTAVCWWNSWTVQSALSSLHTMSHIMAEYSDKKANKTSRPFYRGGNYPIFGQWWSIGGKPKCWIRRHKTGNSAVKRWPVRGVVPSVGRSVGRLVKPWKRLTHISGGMCGCNQERIDFEQPQVFQVRRKCWTPVIRDPPGSRSNEMHNNLSTE